MKEWTILNYFKETEHITTKTYQIIQWLQLIILSLKIFLEFPGLGH